MSFLSFILSFLGMTATPEQLVKNGNTLASKGNLSSAVENYKKAIEINPLLSLAYDALGKVYFKMDYMQEAEREFVIADGLDAIKKDPTNLKAAMNLSKGLMVKGRHKEAKLFIAPALKIRPDSPELLKMMGLCLKALDDNVHAKEFLAASLAGRPTDTDLYLRLGELEMATGNKKNGEWYMNMSRQFSAIEEDVTDTKSRYKIAQLYIERNMLKEAAPWLAKCVEMEPTMHIAWMGLGKVYLQLNQVNAALDAVKSAVRMNPDDHEVLYLLSEVYNRGGDINKAKDVLKDAEALKVGKEGVENPEQGAAYVKFLIGQNKDDDASEQLLIMLKKWPGNADLSLLKGQIYMQADKYQETIDLMKELVAADDKIGMPHVLMAMSHSKLGQNLAALAEGQLASRLDSKNPQVHRVLGDIYRDQKKFSLAENCYETAERLGGKIKRR